MDQRIINLYDEYTHKPLSRKAFLKKLILLTGSAAAAFSVLPLLEVNYAHAQTILANDKRITTERITYSAGETVMNAYLAKPVGKKKMGGVIIIHENRGLNAHIEDVTRRMALEGFIAIAPDALSPLGGTPADADKARDMFQNLDAKQNIINFSGAFHYLTSRNDCTKMIGCVGFCWGGAMANNLAVNLTELKAAVAFYGRQAEAKDVPAIKAALQLHYAQLDERVNAGIQIFEEALKNANVTYQLHMYEGAQHAFHNDTAPTRYNETAAKLAWKRTTDFLKEKLR